VLLPVLRWRIFEQIKTETEICLWWFLVLSHCCHRLQRYSAWLTAVCLSVRLSSVHSQWRVSSALDGEQLRRAADERLSAAVWSDRRPTEAHQYPQVPAVCKSVFCLPWLPSLCPGLCVRTCVFFRQIPHSTICDNAGFRNRRGLDSCPRAPTHNQRFSHVLWKV